MTVGPRKRLPRADRRAQAIEHAADLLREGGPNALTSAMRDRVISDWSSSVIDMNQRVGLPFPEIDLDEGIVSS